MPSEKVPDITSMPDKYAATTWGGDNEFDFKAPSGQLCRLRKMDPVLMISEGLLDRTDFLTSIVLGEHIPNGQKTAIQRAKEAKAKVGTAKQTEEEREEDLKQKVFDSLLGNSEKMKEFVEVLDKIVLRAVVMPEVFPVPTIPDQKRSEEKIYLDTIDFNDKVAIFSRCMRGVTDLEPFREGSEESVAPVARSQRVPNSAKRSPRRKG